MSIYYHIGSSGAGKTTGVQKRIIKEAEREPERSFLFVVPEQFTLQTQREILNRSTSGGMMNIDALSFARLAHRVFEEQGVTLPQVLEDTGKSMIVKKMLLEHADELTIYKGKVKKQGFAEEMKSLIAEFYQYGIDEKSFEKMKESAGDRAILKAKLHDIDIIYKAFAKFIDGRFVMNEEVLDRMCEIAGESKLIRDSVVVLDGFTGFTPSQYNCIDKLMKYAKDIHVVLTADTSIFINQGDGSLIDSLNLKDNDQDLFELSRKTIDKLEELAATNHIASGVITYKDEKGRYRDNPSMAHLEKNIFRFPYKKSDRHEAITLLMAADVEEETDFIVSKIRELVYEGGMHYENIAVVTGDPDSYAPVLERKLLKAGVPHFIDRKKNIEGTGIVEFIDAALDIILSDFSYENVFRFLKTGFTDLEPDDISRAEIYAVERGIKGIRRWSAPWNSKKKDTAAENRVREYVLSVFGGIKEAEAKENSPTIQERLTYIYNLLDSCEVELKLYNLSEKLKNSDEVKDRIKGTELGQLFKTVVTVFERINNLLGSESMPLKEFKEVLDTGFAEAKLRSIPGGADSVVVGDMERTRLDNKQVLFFAGCNDGVIPGARSGGSLLNEFDRELFAENDIELSPTQKDSGSLTEFYLYLTLTKPSKKLYLSYARKTGDEKEARPAYIFGRIMKLYTGLQVNKLSSYEKDNIYRIIGCDRGLGAVIELMRDKGTSTDTNEAGRILAGIFEKENEELMEMLKAAASGKRNKGILSEEEAEKLYGTVILGSITRLQKFAECAFAHFAKFGLRLQDAKEFSIGGLEIGTICHDALKAYADDLKKDGLRWPECTGADRKEREAKAMDEAFLDYEEIISSSKRYEYIRKSLKRVFSRTVDIVTKQIAAGKFDVGFVEKEFYHESTIMKLKGKIDRVDVVKKNGKTYYRIIDYKTGSTAFNIEKVKAGLQLQLAIYTAEAAATLFEAGDTPAPAGMYYYKIDDPLIESKEGNPGTDEEPEADIIKKQRLDGITVGEDDVLSLTDSALYSEDGNRIPGSSTVINLSFKKDGGISQHSESAVVTQEDFDLINTIASKKAETLARDILSGNVAADPYEYKTENACKYCDYRSVCQFDRHLGDRFRKV
ncbi:MAG: PD-(D/E)XK nuclease family protein [Lachnospiraceae bacterium]|nr:PD-(D/E)XK nuclease family protein [Lachnospiraceae bacterium]